ncbi:MAG: hypothetical protein IH591_20340 [Bacteroidales bacterium]|nr:hypothetical protein [Bacteroidales bacterium]
MKQGKVDAGYTKKESEFLLSLSDPWAIQEFLDSIAYNPNYECRSPRYVIEKKSAHCFEGALLAAAALEFNGDRPLLVDLRAFNDDDHVIAVFRRGNLWGAVAKSNFTTLRYREPVYRSLRELVMSYFDFYFNIYGDKSLREYSVPLDLSCYSQRQWQTADEDLEYIGDRLNLIRHYPVISSESVESLKRASDIMLQAGMLGSDEEGLYKPTIK